LSDPQQPSKVKACIGWILGWVLEVSPRLAAWLSRVVMWIWPGFREK
jgi:hypothetical protein